MAQPGMSCPVRRNLRGCGGRVGLAAHGGLRSGRGCGRNAVKGSGQQLRQTSKQSLHAADECRCELLVALMLQQHRCAVMLKDVHQSSPSQSAADIGRAEGRFRSYLFRAHARSHTANNCLVSWNHSCRPYTINFALRDNSLWCNCLSFPHRAWPGFVGKTLPPIVQCNMHPSPRRCKRRNNPNLPHGRERCSPATQAVAAVSRA